MTRIKSHVLEKCIAALMILLGIAAAYIAYAFFATNKALTLSKDVAVIEILIIIVIAILAQSIILIKIFEQHDN
ncbi:MAG: hypothetical protein WC755_02995 [Candidatus Woesearchaeota archaeon]|jgi:hypothetical protein